jgi:hypothetical protein
VNDVHGNAWIVDAKGSMVPEDAVGLERWISEGRAAATRETTLEERGTVEGVIYEPPFSFEDWREQFRVIREAAE